ncbi:MAG: ABC transporter ATP-binding protein, partial [Ignavibacteria bacterium]|nr:ABC transporter ATP-binding protein [Ignavibacteria bacterium]
MDTKSKSKVTIGHVFKTIIWPRKNILLVGLILIIISRLASLVLPGASKYLMDDVIADGNIEMLETLLLIVGASIIVQAITSFLLTKLLSVEAQRLIAILRVKVQKQILKLPIKFFDNNKSGALVSRIMSDVEGVRNLVGTGLVQLFGGILTAVISLFLLINISPMMTLYVLVPISIFGVISLKAFSYIRPIFRERRVINA